MKLIWLMIFIASLFSCKTRESSGDKSPSELQAIYDKKNFLLRAVPDQGPVGAQEPHLRFEVCKVSGDLGTIIGNTCVDAFVTVDKKLFTFSLKDLKSALSKKELEVFDWLREENNVDYLYFIRGATRGVGRGSESTMDDVRIQQLTIEGVMKRVAVINLAEPGFLAVFLGVSISEQFQMVMRMSRFFTAAFSRQPKRGKLDKVDFGTLRQMDLKEVEVVLEESYKDLSAVALSVESLINTDPTEPKQKVASVFDVLHDLGTYLKQKMPAKNIKAYCYPVRSAPRSGGLRSRCRAL